MWKRRPFGLLVEPASWPLSAEERLMFAGTRLRVIGLAIWVGWVSLLAIFGGTVLHTVHDERLHHEHIWMLLMGAVLFHALMYLLPWRRLVARRVSELILYLWAAAILAFVGLLLYWAGPHTSDFYLVYVLLILFAAAAFRRRIYFALVAVAVAGYLGIAMATASPRDVIVRVTAILLIAAMAGHLASEQRSRARSIALLHEAMVSLASERDLPAIETAFVRWARRLVDAEGAALFLPHNGRSVRDPPDAPLDLPELPLEEAAGVERPKLLTVGAARTAIVSLGPSGVLAVRGVDEASFAPHKYVLETLAAQAAAAMETAKLHRGLAEKERARAALLRDLIHAQEEERRRIARELHDGPTQDVAGLVVGLEASERTPGTMDLRELKELARSAADELRRLILDLRPAVLDDLGLAAALRWLAHERHERQRVQLETRLDRPVPPPLDTAVFRIVQEALANVERHAQAGMVCVRVEAVNGHVLVVVEDDGRGFDPSESQRGFGIVGIRERAEQLAGTVSISSTSGGGTRVEARLPLGD